MFLSTLLSSKTYVYGGRVDTVVTLFSQSSGRGYSTDQYIDRTPATNRTQPPYLVSLIQINMKGIFTLDTHYSILLPLCCSTTHLSGLFLCFVVVGRERRHALGLMTDRRRKRNGNTYFISWSCIPSFCFIKTSWQICIRKCGSQ